MNVEKRQLSPECTQKTELKKQRLLANFDMGLCEKPTVEKRQQTTVGYDFFFQNEFDFDMDAFGDTQPEINVKEDKLDLSSWKRCVIEKMERDRKTFDIVLELSATDEPTPQKPRDTKEFTAAEETVRRSTICRLQGPWCYTRVEVGDLVYLLAVWDDQLQSYKVSKDDGFCVTNPDTLISGTSVVGSLFCRRKAVLQDRFRGVDPNSKIMVIGSIVHELFQTVLLKGLKTYKEIQDAAEKLLDSQEIAYMLYDSLMSRKETEQEVQAFVPNIVKFVARYIGGQKVAASVENQFEGTITEIQDIEENLWVPQLGLKGKVDVSVRIKRRRDKCELNFPPSSHQNVLPLELKTGKATFSNEHKGQVALYQMMLTVTGRETSSGLLLYLREGIMREMQCTRNEQRDLIVVRNDLSHYLTRTPTAAALSAPLPLGDGKLLQPFELPEPISHHSACGNCAYATICCSFVQTDPALELPAGHPLVKVIGESTSHLQPADYEYFIHWCGLLTLEEQEARSSSNLRSLWTDPPDVRVCNGRALADLELQGPVEYKETRYLHTFRIKNEEVKQQKRGDEQQDLTFCGFSLGEYVIISSTKRLAVAAGCVYDLSKSSISISLERNLLKNYTGHSFIVDKHESQFGNVFNYTNLGLLLDNTERAATLRSIIVQREQPTFAKLLPQAVATKGAEILKQLNPIQRAAALKALTTEMFMLIKGLPGTGKTQTLVAIIRLLHLLEKSVIITSHTHSAVDNLMIRLKAHSLPMIRLGSGARINPQLNEFGESALTANCRSESDFARVYSSYNIVGVTCLGAAHSIFLHRRFDFCIVDEATQVMQCSVLRPLFFCQRFILVGDPDQLPPLIRSKEARQRGADESLFLRLDTPTATKVLTLQYRMNKTITKLANHLTYSGNLRCANKDVEVAVMKPQQSASKDMSNVSERWVQRVLSAHIDQAVFFLDTGDCSERSCAIGSIKHSSTFAALELTFADEPTRTTTSSDPNKSHTIKRISKYTNYCDAAIIFHIVKHLLSAGYEADRIGIVAPYRAQVELLRKLAEQHADLPYNSKLSFAQVEVNTVDQYQGRDKDIVIYSCTKTGAAAAAAAGDVERARNAEILEDKRRLTVAITRSKHKLILVGDSASLKLYTPFNELLTRIPSYCKMMVEEGRLDFSWEPLFASLSEVIKGSS